MISAEVESLARTGGLGDVALALSKHVADLGTHVLLVTPLYGVTRLPARTVRWRDPVDVRVGWGPGDVRRVEVLELPGFGVDSASGTSHLRVCLLVDPDLFARDGIYGDRHGTFGDNELRFATLSRGALEIAARAWGAPEPRAAGCIGESGPDVIHAHDWHTAPAVLYARLTMGDGWRTRASAFTIHNLAYQGVLGVGALDHLALPRAAFESGALAHQGSVNLMKGAIAYADRVTTVSPNYAWEITTREGGMGLDGFLAENAGKLVGVVNGIDTARFDPCTDTTLVCRYDAKTAPDGRRACKRALLAELGLDGDLDRPLFATVSRLTWQKGMDLLLEAMPALVDRGARIAVVGQGDQPLERALLEAAARYPGKVATRIAFDPVLARRVYAGTDFFMVPSRFEPCGLTQMYAMRYGAIPIVTEVGGLKDTVSHLDVLEQRGTGIVATSASLAEILVACEDALTVYADPPSFRELQMRAMARESSWDTSAREYQALYQALATEPPT
jgi:starch synthase